MTAPDLHSAMQVLAQHQYAPPNGHATDSADAGEPPLKNGIQANVENASFEFGLMFALNPSSSFSIPELAGDFGMPRQRVETIIRQLAKGRLIERVAPGKYRASVALQRMVRMHAPRDAS